jgi:CRP/FNR family transcriptional regulator, cyclic AMP receptor protein
MEGVAKMHRADHGKDEFVRLLDIDDELAERVPGEQREVARRKLTARIHTFEPGQTGLEECAPDDCVGLLVVDGFLTRDVVFCGRQSRELIGPGDLMRPWDFERDFLPPFAQPGFTIIERTRLAELDRRLLAVGGVWPGFVNELLHRAIDRSRWLAVRLAISTAIRVDERLLLFFWHNAGRWGRMTPDGVLLPFSFTHSVLAELVGAQRATITTALSQLRAAGKIEFVRDEQRRRRTVLLGEPPEPLSSTSGKEVTEATVPEPGEKARVNGDVPV